MLKDQETKGDEARAQKLRRRDLERSDLSSRDEAIEKKLREHDTLLITYYVYCDEWETQRWIYRKEGEGCGRFYGGVGKEGYGMWIMLSAHPDCLHDSLLQ